MLNLSRRGRTQTSCILNARRIQEDISTVLKPVSLILDGSKEVTVLFPRMNIDLFDRLQSNQENPIGLVRGLRIVQQMTDALENCWIRGIHHVDLRITNVLVLMIFLPFLWLFQVGFPWQFSWGPLDEFVCVFLVGVHVKHIFKKRNLHHDTFLGLPQEIKIWCYHWLDVSRGYSLLRNLLMEVWSFVHWQTIDEAICWKALETGGGRKRK